MKLSIKKVFHCSVKKMRTKEKFHFLDIPAFLPLGPIIQKPFLLFWQNLKWQNISICQFKKVLTFDLEKLLLFEILKAEGYPNGKQIVPYQVSYKFHICYWVLFANSSLAIIEDMDSGSLNSHSFLCKLTEGD